MANEEWLARFGPTLYPIANVALLLAALGGAGVHDAPIGLAVYACVLFAICSAPLLLMKRINDRYAILGVFMLLYFLFFGALDVQHILFGADKPLAERTAFLTGAELAILLAGALTLFGYRAGARLWRPGEHPQPMAEWPASTIMVVGICIWVLGTAAMLYFSIVAVPEKTNAATTRGFALMGPALTFLVMLGHLMEPLGIVILAYGYAKHRGPLWLALVLVVVSVQVFVGFVEDVKMQAFAGIVLATMVLTLVRSRVPKGWLAGGVVFLIVAFPIFQAYREFVTGERGLDRGQAFSQLDKVVDVVLASREKAAEGGVGQERAQTFLERSSGKQMLELLLDRVGKDVAFLHGRSLIAIPMAFVPRLLVPDKEDVAVGQLFNKEVLKEDTDTNISISHLGELYWNFGWAAVFIGMPLFGMLLGFVGAKFSLDQGLSLTRVLVLLVTIQTLCMGFGGTMPVAYVNWLRSMAAIGLMHLIFARRTAASGAPTEAGRPDVSPTGEPGRSLALSPPTPRFSNMLR